VISVFFFLPWLAPIWKNFVFLSHAVSHCTLDHCCHIISSLWLSSTILSITLISAWEGPCLFGSACILSSSSFNLLNSSRTWPKVDRPQLSRLVANTRRKVSVYHDWHFRSLLKTPPSTTILGGFVVDWKTFFPCFGGPLLLWIRANHGRWSSGAW
jgi:hypothetical protein